MKSATTAPHRKVVGATVGSGLGAALSTIIIWALTTYGHADVPGGIAVALTVVVSSACAFAAGYIVPPDAADVPVPA